MGDLPQPFLEEWSSTRRTRPPDPPSEPEGGCWMTPTDPAKASRPEARREVASDGYGRGSEGVSRCEEVSPGESRYRDPRGPIGLRPAGCPSRSIGDWPGSVFGPGPATVVRRGVTAFAPCRKSRKPTEWGE